MGLLGNSNFSDYDKLGQALRTYEGAEKFVLAKIAPVTNGISNLIFPDGALALALLALSYWGIRQQPGQAIRYLLFVAFIGIMMAPVRAGENHLPWSFYAFNSVTSEMLALLQGAVDQSLGKAGGPGNYAATLQPLSLYSLAGRDNFRGTELAKTLSIYQDECSPQPKSGAAMTIEELRSVGLMGGPVGVSTPGVERVRAAALKKLEQLPPGGSPTGIIDSGELQGGFYIESATSWRSRNNNPTLAPGFLTNNDSALKYPAYLLGGQADPSDPHAFYAHDCASLYRIVEMSAGEYYTSIAERVRAMNQSVGLADDKDRTGLVVLGAQLAAAHSIHAATRDTNEQNSGGMSDSVLNGIETLLVTAAMKVVSVASEFMTKWFAFLIPGIAALAVGIQFVFFPIAVLLALVPGRESSLATYLYFNVFVKLFLLIAYVMLKLGGFVFLAAVDDFARSGGQSSFAAVTLVGGLIIAIAVLWGAPSFAHALTFSQTHGLARAFGYGALGGPQMERAAQRITSRVSNVAPRLSLSNPVPGPHTQQPRQLSALKPSLSADRNVTLNSVGSRVGKDVDGKA